MGFIWHSPRESTGISGSENICQAEIRRIGPELSTCFVLCERLQLLESRDYKIPFYLYNIPIL